MLFHIVTQKRGHDILGLSESFGGDQLPYPTLSYANGLGYYNTYAENGSRTDFRTSGANFSDPQHAYMSMVPMLEETHGGDDVGVYATGPWSHLFTGNYEQNNIPVAMAYAAQIGAYAPPGGPKKCSGVARGMRMHGWLMGGGVLAVMLAALLRM